MAQCKLTERIILEKCQSTQDDEGFETQTWSCFYTCWSGFRTIKGSEFIAAKATNSENIVTFTIRYCKKSSELLKQNATKLYRVNYNGSLYNIVYCNDYNNSKSLIDIKAILIN